MSIQVPPNSTGSILDTLTPTTARERQIVALGDPLVGAAQATVNQIANSTAGEAAALIVDTPKHWAVSAVPASATQASAVKAAGAAGVQHVCDAVSATLAVDGTHAQTAIILQVLDGVTVIWEVTVLKSATEAMSVFHFSGLGLVGTAATSMTAQFSAAGVTGSVQSVAITGHDIS